MRRPRWYRWSVVTVGRESGNRRGLIFIRFRHEKQAVEWCVRANAQHEGDLIYYEPEEIKGE